MDIKWYITILPFEELDWTLSLRCQVAKLLFDQRTFDLYSLSLSTISLATDCYYTFTFPAFSISYLLPQDSLFLVKLADFGTALYGRPDQDPQPLTIGQVHSSLVPVLLVVYNSGKYTY